MKTVIRPETEMKDSGINYIEKIPIDWIIRKGKTLYSVNTGKLDVNAENSNGLYPFFTCSMHPKRINTYAFDCEALLVAGNGVVGFTQYFNGKFNAYQRTYVLSNFKMVLPIYLKYYVSNRLIDAVAPNSVGSVIQFIKLGDLQNFCVAMPKNELEQQAIADYLDETCSQIDEIIEEAEVSIDEYKKLRQSIIFEVVTRGLDKNVEVKETGEKWLHNIPNHWRMEKGKNLLFETNVRSVDGQEELLTVSQYTGVTPRSKKNVTMFQAESLVGYKICEVGDVAANTMWMWAGAVGVSKYHGVISPSYNTYRQKHNDYNCDYLDYLLRIAPLVDEYASLSTGIRASRLRLYPTQFLSINYPVPPLVEQMNIVNWLDKHIPQIDSLITEKESLINDLEAYKKSLIYEVVTGKRKVI